MSVTKYLEIDSSFRDRNKNPNVAEFEIPISISGTKGRNDALDPVSLASPILHWKGNNLDLITSSGSVSITVSSTNENDKLSFINTGSKFNVSAPSGTLHKTKNYYSNLVATNTNSGLKRRIVCYEFIGTDSLGNEKAIITLRSGFGDGLSSGDVIQIDDPSDFTDLENSILFIPNGVEGSNRYVECILYNQTRNEYRNISNYDGITKTVKISGPVITGWETSDKFCLRKIPPCCYGVISSAEVSSIVLEETQSSSNNIYYHYFIRMTSGVTENEIRYISSYDGVTKTLNLTKPFTTGVPSGGDTYEILQFSYDNAYPFVYSGDLSATHEEECYEIELMNVVIPNKTLKNGYGDRVAYYPYCYVELVNVSGSSAGNRNIIYSNNPNSVKSLFRTVVYDTSNPANTNFVKLSGGGMSQSIKFKPNDTLKFSLKLHNGDLYIPDELDTVSPLEPNPCLQVSACFSIKKLR